MTFPEALDAARAGLFAWDVASGAVHWDDFVCSLVGVAPEEFDGRADAFFDALHAADAARLAAATAKALERGGRYRNHYRIVHPDGRIRRIEERGEVLLDADGRPERVLGLLLDRSSDGPDPGYPEVPTAALDATSGYGHGYGPYADSSDAFLLTITRALSRATTADDVMQVLTDMARPSLGAETLLVSLTPTGDPHEIGTVTLHEPLPEELHPLRPAAAAAMRRALVQEKPVFVEGISAPPPPGRRPVVRTWAVLPLASSDQRHGSCLFGYPGARRFDEAQRSLFTALSGIIAHALGRALLYDAEHQRATELQRAMLPRRVPHVPHHTVAVRYRPGTAGMEVGGDWYEVLELDGDRVGLVIGDVQGHSARASAVMGQLRIALRAFAREGHDPAGTLARTSRLLSDLDTDLFATCCYLTLEPATGRLSAARAGHPLPVRLESSGAARELDLPGGPPLGVDPAAEYPLAEHRLGVGEGLLLYTDGLIEDREESYDESVDRLLAALAEGGRPPARTGWESLADRLVRPRDTAATQRDDLALLLLRRDA
ncbi:SpoIIE family protein phosphatase [Streptacidiphilus sp. NEAU-YB345]|uniref:protein-serine/threonine phosphatase n=1 Tax=Streptacidiphilus fuscans TaxID=2789292 RepID=A0A931B0F5_9ACTN|nr:SpoIIE family protein phosphatase [Streptacidiphilus fuscans]